MLPYNVNIDLFMESICQEMFHHLWISELFMMASSYDPTIPGIGMSYNCDMGSHQTNHKIGVHLLNFWTKVFLQLTGNYIYSVL